MPKKVVKFIDLFSGMGGIRLGFEQAFKKAGYNTKCVLTLEIKDCSTKGSFKRKRAVGKGSFKRKRAVGKAYFLRKKNHYWHHYLLPVLN